MRKLGGTLTALAIGGAVMVGGYSSVMAQEASPVAVDPSECSVEPRTVDALVTIFMAGDYAPDEAISSGILPEGSPAPDDTAASVNATMRLVIACSNANDLPRLLALFTDRGVQFFGPEDSDATEQQIRDFFASQEATPVPVDERELYVPLQDVVVLNDGRVGGLFPATNDEGAEVYVIFANVDGTWLIDEANEINSPATPTA